MSTDSRAQVLQATDLVELVSQTVALQRRGKSFVGLCPFHQERTPSFHVDPSKQYFMCFGCKASGTAFDFVMRRDRVEFREALEILARRAGIELPHFSGEKHKPGERQALLDAQSAACQFFQNLLAADSEEAGAARAYLAKRGFTDATLKQFQVGLAANAWDALLKGPVGRKFPPALLAAAGLVKPRQQGEGFYDTFRHRIMFPIRNEGGQIIAFGGRVMPGSDDPAKYLNSPETAVFSKSRTIFGIDLARAKIVETRTCAVVEGYTDVAMAHQFGASNVVSVLGTAMTEQHVTVLRRFADRIVLLFDADAAGDAAVDRVVQLFLTQPVEIAVASIPDGLDPDEYLLKYGIAEFESLLAGAPDALGYAWKQLSRRFVQKTGDLTGQQKAIEEYLDLLAQARGAGPVDPLRWGASLVRVSKLTEIPADELGKRFRFRAGSHGKPKVAGADQPTNAVQGSVAPVPAREVAERQILGTLLLEPSRWQDVQLALKVDDFLTPALRTLARIYWDYQRDEGEPVFNEFIAALPDAELKPLAIELVQHMEHLATRQSAELQSILKGSMDYLAEVARQRDNQTLLSAVRNNALSSEQEQVDALRRLQEAARKPDLRRLGR